MKKDKSPQEEGEESEGMEVDSWIKAHIVVPFKLVTANVTIMYISFYMNVIYYLKNLLNEMTPKNLGPVLIYELQYYCNIFKSL